METQNNFSLSHLRAAAFIFSLFISGPCTPLNATNGTEQEKTFYESRFQIMRAIHNLEQQINQKLLPDDQAKIITQFFEKEQQFLEKSSPTDNEKLLRKLDWHKATDQSIKEAIDQFKMFQETNENYLQLIEQKQPEQQTAIDETIKSIIMVKTIELMQHLFFLPQLKPEPLLHDQIKDIINSAIQVVIEQTKTFLKRKFQALSQAARSIFLGTRLTTFWHRKEKEKKPQKEKPIPKKERLEPKEEEEVPAITRVIRYFAPPEVKETYTLEKGKPIPPQPEPPLEEKKKEEKKPPELPVPAQFPPQAPSEINPPLTPFMPTRLPTPGPEQARSTPEYHPETHPREPGIVTPALPRDFVPDKAIPKERIEPSIEITEPVTTKEEPIAMTPVAVEKKEERKAKKAPTAEQIAQKKEALKLQKREEEKRKVTRLYQRFIESKKRTLKQPRKRPLKTSTKKESPLYSTTSPE